MKREKPGFSFFFLGREVFICFLFSEAVEIFHGRTSQNLEFNKRGRIHFYVFCLLSWVLASLQEVVSVRPSVRLSVTHELKLCKSVFLTKIEINVDLKQETMTT